VESGGVALGPRPGHPAPSAGHPQRGRFRSAGRDEGAARLSRSELAGTSCGWRSGWWSEGPPLPAPAPPGPVCRPRGEVRPVRATPRRSRRPKGGARACDRRCCVSHRCSWRPGTPVHASSPDQDGPARAVARRRRHRPRTPRGRSGARPGRPAGGTDGSDSPCPRREETRPRRSLPSHVRDEGGSARRPCRCSALARPAARPTARQRRRADGSRTGQFRIQAVAGQAGPGPASEALGKGTGEPAVCRPAERASRDT
jgi:hypothetical protein